MAAATGASQFLATTVERAEFNQYWYSRASIETVRIMTHIYSLQ